MVGTGARLYQKQTPLMLVVENMVEAGRLRLVVPRVVIEEFRKDRTKVAKASACSQSLESLPSSLESMRVSSRDVSPISRHANHIKELCAPITRREEDQ